MGNPCKKPKACCQALAPTEYSCRMEDLRTQGPPFLQDTNRKLRPHPRHCTSAAQEVDPRMQRNPPEAPLLPCCRKEVPTPHPAPPEAAASPGSLLTMQNLGLHLGPTEAKPAFSYNTQAVGAPITLKSTVYNRGFQARACTRSPGGLVTAHSTGPHP